MGVNPFTAKLSNLNLYPPIKVVSRCSDRQVVVNYSYLLNQTFANLECSIPFPFPITVISPGNEQRRIQSSGLGGKRGAWGSDNNWVDLLQFFF